MLLLLLFWVGYSFAGTNYRTTINITYDNQSVPISNFLNAPANLMTITSTAGVNDTIFISDGDTLKIENVPFDLTKFILPMIIVIEKNDASPEKGGMLHFAGGNSGLMLNPGSDIIVDPQNLDGLIYSNVKGNGNSNALGKPVIFIGATTIVVKQLAEIIYLGSLSALLPVEFVFFRAQVQDGGVRLNWQTAWELDNDYFEVQHSSDGNDFALLAKVKGQGTTVFFANY